MLPVAFRVDWAAPCDAADSGRVVTATEAAPPTSVASAGAGCPTQTDDGDLFCGALDADEIGGAGAHGRTGDADSGWPGSMPGRPGVSIARG